MPADTPPGVTFMDLAQDAADAVAKLSLAVAARRQLDAVADSAAAVVPAEFRIVVDFDGHAYRLPPDALGVDSLAQLVSPMRQATGDAILDAVADIQDAADALTAFCKDQQAEGADDAPSEPPPAGKPPRKHAPAAGDDRGGPHDGP